MRHTSHTLRAPHMPTAMLLLSCSHTHEHLPSTANALLSARPGVLDHSLGRGPCRDSTSNIMSQQARRKPKPPSFPTLCWAHFSLHHKQKAVQQHQALSGFSRCWIHQSPDRMAANLCSKCNSAMCNQGAQHTRSEKQCNEGAYISHSLTEGWSKQPVSCWRSASSTR
jgi:hypothetical protein